MHTHTHQNHWRTIAHRQGIESRGDEQTDQHYLSGALVFYPMIEEVAVCAGSQTFSIITLVGNKCNEKLQVQ